MRRDDWQYIQNHPFRTRVRALESLNELETLRQFLADLLALCGTHRFLQLFVELGEIDLSKKFPDRFSAHAGDEIFAILLLRLAIFDFVEQLRLLQRRLAGINDDVVLVIDDALGLTRARVTSTPHRSQITPLCLMRLYFPQEHSQSRVGPKMRSQKRPPFSGLNVR